MSRYHVTIPKLHSTHENISQSLSATRLSYEKKASENNIKKKSWVISHSPQTMDSTQKFFQVSKLDGDNGIKYFRLSKTEPLFLNSLEPRQTRRERSAAAERPNAGQAAAVVARRVGEERKDASMDNFQQTWNHFAKAALLLCSLRHGKKTHTECWGRAEQLSGQTKKKLSVSSSFEVYKSIWLKVVGCRFLRSRAWKRLQNFIYKCLSRGSEKLNLGSVSILVSSVQPTSSKTKVIFCLLRTESASAIC